jgi:hypothetical protein
VNHPWMAYLWAQLGMRIHRARTAPSRGASAVEWVIITAIIAGVAMGLALMIKTVVGDWQTRIQDTLQDG